MDAMAGSLWRAGLRPGERVAFFLTNDAGREFMLTSLGRWRWARWWCR